jgi:hypothetical protein
VGKDEPSLVVLPPSMLEEVVSLLKVPCALDTVVGAEGGTVLIGDEGFELLQLPGIAEVAVDLVDVAAREVLVRGSMSVEN